LADKEIREKEQVQKFEIMKQVIANIEQEKMAENRK
jgi:hypothetical protein